MYFLKKIAPNTRRKVPDFRAEKNAQNPVTSLAVVAFMVLIVMIVTTRSLSHAVLALSGHAIAKCLLANGGVGGVALDSEELKKAVAVSEEKIQQRSRRRGRFSSSRFPCRKKCPNLGRDSISCCRKIGEEFSSSVEICRKTFPARNFGQPQPSRAFLLISSSELWEPESHDPALGLWISKRALW